MKILYQSTLQKPTVPPISLTRRYSSPRIR
jgi:hypothetical protein